MYILLIQFCVKYSNIQIAVEVVLFSTVVNVVVILFKGSQKHNPISNF